MSKVVPGCNMIPNAVETCVMFGLHSFSSQAMPPRTVQATQLLYLQYATSDASPMQMRNDFYPRSRI